MEEPPVALILIIGFGGSLLLGGVTLYFLRDKLQFGVLFWMIRAKVVAQADAAPMSPFAFTLRYVSQAAKLHRVCLKLR
ncbi:MAG: hypothetical protein JRI68_16190, partial [Deltaproteobacteria bacterium]|nr:hypothetical protein [Deltaproteobacteria bacterium]